MLSKIYVGGGVGVVEHPGKCTVLVWEGGLTIKTECLTLLYNSLVYTDASEWEKIVRLIKIEMIW